jgi:O-acetyl-ADP-ribose deacetylase (regulator of RNase III)
MKIELIKGDITKIQTDAIVNAANSSLLGGGGVDGAIHRAGGPEILEECRDQKQTGQMQYRRSCSNGAGNLPAKYVIHTVGPVWNGNEEKVSKLLAECYYNSLKLAESLGVKTIAFPNISTGIYRFPKESGRKNCCR